MRDRGDVAGDRGDVAGDRGDVAGDRGDVAGDRGEGSLSPGLRHRLVAKVEQAEAVGRELFEWWMRSEAEYRLAHIPLVRQPNGTLRNYGFLAEAPLRGGLLPVLGVVQETFYDRCKIGQLGWYRAQIEAFVSRHFLDLSWSVRPGLEARRGHGAEEGDFESPRGWRYSQLFYKLKESGRVGTFPRDQRHRMVDLRQIGTTYDWIILQVRLFNLTMERHLAGADGPRLELPVIQNVYALMSPTFVVHREDPDPGVIGEYGYGYSVIPTHPREPEILAYGPERLIGGFEFIHFRLHSNGEIWVRAVFVADQPNRLIDVDPVAWGFGLADAVSLGTASRALAPLKNVLERIRLPEFSPLFTLIHLSNTFTGGIAARQFCVSESRLLRDLMALHCLVLDNFITETIPTWSQVPDWLDRDSLPIWVRRSSPGLP